MAILTQPWPADLDPKRVPYRTRTPTTLQRMGAWDDPTRFAELTVAWRAQSSCARPPAADWHACQPTAGQLCS